MSDKERELVEYFIKIVEETPSLHENWINPPMKITTWKYLLELDKQLENLKNTNEEHRVLNGELREENKKLQEEATYMTQKAYDFFSALLDIKELVVNNACLDESINKCVDDLIYYKCDELLNIVNKALEKDMITKETIEKLRSDKE